jgi:LacI family transcriptional regulator
MKQSSRIRSKPTQAEVAKLAGTSQAIVSYVITNSPHVSISSETRQRVLGAVAQLGYVPDRMARNLRSRKTYTIASIIPDITNPFYPAVERAIQDVADQHGYEVIIYNTDGLAAKEQKCLESAQRSGADGLIGVFFHLTESDLASLHIPLVHVLGYAPTQPQPFDVIFMDNAAAARKAVSYLIERGHTRIGMIAGLEATPPRLHRILGYRQALAEHHLPLDEILIRGGDFTEKGGYEGMQELLRLSPRPSAVFAANDLMAMGALMALREAGLRVPEDMAVVGFDDIPAARLVNPPLTTIVQFQEMLGRRIAEMLFERLNGTAPAYTRAEPLPFELVVRQSA